MSLSPGTRLGPYEVAAQIGVGGMGEVYRATDTNLKRAVAIKVLPASVAADAERLARFQREAEVLASLNHPNIAQIHGLEKSDGITALVMELVEGPTLAEQIAGRAGPSGPAGLPIDEALPIAKQIAEALEAAHEQGIIHRDLKPANIKVRPDGTVKVLDFGLAKAMAPAAGPSPSASMSPTITTPAMTQAGMILGTAAYMSPEQARGAPVDKRADLWAFGVVLWEMLTGTRLFEGATVSDTLAAVLKTEPVWTALPPATPPAIRRLLRRCLEKDRRRRLDSAAGARLEIEDALLAPSAFEGSAATAVTTSAAPATSSTSRGRLALMAALAVAAVMIVAMAVPTVRHLRETPAPETRVEISTPATDEPASFALSPDGRQIVFVASGDGTSRLWVMPMAGDRTPSALLKTPFREAYGEFSPDNRWVAYHSEESGRMEIYVRPFVPAPVQPSAAGTPRLRSGQAAEAAGGQWQVSTAGGIHPVWSPDGNELYYLNPQGVMMAAPITVTGAKFAPGAPAVLFPTRIYGGGVDTGAGRQYDVAPDGRFLINTVLGSAAAPITLLQNWNPEAKK